MRKFLWPVACFFCCAILALPASGELVFSEIDSNQAGMDSGEFVEIYDGGTGGTSLDGLLLVFFNGETDTAYLVIDLSGQETDEAGYFVAGNAGVSPRPDVIFGDNTLQNGADAVALYDGALVGYAQDNEAPPTTVGLLAAVVYGNGSDEDAGLLVLLEAGQLQLDENGNGASESHSLQRCPSLEVGALQTQGFVAALPTPGAANLCPQEPGRVVINEVDANQTDADTLEFVELYDGGVGYTPLDGLVLVFFNGSVESSYLSVDLDGLTTDAQGYFLLGNAEILPELVLVDGALQNGPDAVALYQGNANDFPAGSLPDTQGLLDAVVYTTGEVEETALLSLVGGIGPVASEGPDTDTKSLQRCPNGEGLPLSLSPFTAALPTPRAMNVCSASLPVADFTFAPLQVYAGVPVTFSDASTGNVDTWHWSFEGGSPAGSEIATPEAVVFQAPGLAQVSLQVDGPLGSDVQTRSIQVLDAAPLAEGIVLSQESVFPCDAVVFSVLNPSGELPLAYLWSVKDAGGQEVFSGEGSSIVWEVDALAGAGGHTATLTVSNGKGSFSTEPRNFGVSSIRPSIELSTPQSSLTRLPQAVVDIVVDGSDAASDFGADDLVLVNAALQTLEGADSVYQAVVNFVAEGPAAVQVREGAAFVRCGVPSFASNTLQFTYDATGPQATLQSDAPPVFTETGFFVDVAFDEPVTGLEENDFLLTNAIVGNLSGEADQYVLTVIALSPGKVEVRLAGAAVTDAAGNTSLESAMLTRSYLSEAALFTHSADSNQDGRIDLSEILRVVQLYNAAEFRCDPASEDGFALGSGDRECAAHSSDYVLQDWALDLSELLRAVQMYAASGYYACDSPVAEDGFCLGEIAGR